MGAATSLNPEQLSERARNASKARTSPDYFIAQLSKVELTQEQADQLVKLVAPFLLAAAQR